MRGGPPQWPDPTEPQALPAWKALMTPAHVSVFQVILCFHQGMSGCKLRSGAQVDSDTSPSPNYPHWLRPGTSHPFVSLF